MSSKDSPRESISSLVRWEGPGSGFESSSGAVAGGVWKSGNLVICPFGIEVEKPGVRTAWNIADQKFDGLELKLNALIFSFRDLDRHLYQKMM